MGNKNDPSTDLGIFSQSAEGPYPNPIKTVEKFCDELVMFPLKTRDIVLAGTFSDDPIEDIRERQRRMAELKNRWWKLMQAFLGAATDKFDHEYRRYIVDVILLFDYDCFRLSHLEDAQKAAKKVREATPLRFAEYRKLQTEIERSKIPAPIRKLINLVNAGVVTERGMNLATCTIDRTGKKLFELEGVDYRTHWILDCLADKFVKQNNYEVLRNKQDKPLLLPEDVEASRVAGIMTVLDADKALRIAISETEIKRTLGLSDSYPNWRIQEIIFGCRKAAVTGSIRLLYENGHRRVINAWGTLFSDIIEIEDSHLPPQKGVDPKRRVRRSYIFCFGNISGVVFLSNLLQGKLTAFPKGFYQLPGGPENLYRYFSNFPGPLHYGIRQLADIAGYTEKDITKLKLALNKALDTLQKEGFIEHWEPGKGRGMETTYHIILNPHPGARADSTPSVGRIPPPR